MKAGRDESGNVILTLTPEEAHVFIWGGPEDIVNGLEGSIRAIVLAVEENDMSNAEYREKFDDLDAMYAKMRPGLAFYGFLGKETPA